MKNIKTLRGYNKHRSYNVKRKKNNYGIKGTYLQS